jgi:3-oxoacyl-[acyl-carrier protein] reductase
LMVSSLGGITGHGSSLAYVASKGALNTMTLSLARSLAPRIRVNAICPGFIDTGWFRDAYNAMAMQRLRERVRITNPLRLASNAEDIAKAAQFLMSDYAHHITGETLIVDAGAHLGPPILRNFWPDP